MNDYYSFNRSFKGTWHFACVCGLCFLREFIFAIVTTCIKTCITTDGERALNIFCFYFSS